VVVHLAPDGLDCECILSEQELGGEILDHRGGGRSARAVSDGRFPDTHDPLIGDDLS
jgi:hypothetical protein